MGLKNNKCCCGRCPEFCVNTGSIRVECQTCYETPEWYQIIFPEGDWFVQCCPDLTSLSTHILRENLATDDCRWSFVFPETACGNGLTYDWQLVVEGTDPGDVTLTLELSNGDVVVFKNVRQWNCLCTNEMVLEYSTAYNCDVPPFVCVVAVDSCCSFSRSEGLPDTLYLSFINLNDCECVEDGSVALNWDGTAKRWIGDGFYGSCVDTAFGDPVEVHAEVYCLPLAPPAGSGCPFLRLDLVIGSNLAVPCTEVTASVPDPLCTCDPVFATFPNGDEFTTPTCCTIASLATQIKAVLTETAP